MPIGPILLTILLVLIYFGFLERVLDRMRLTGRQALAMVAAMLLGSFFTFTLAPGLGINLGGGILPLALVAYLLITADQWFEPVRAILAGIVTAGAVFMIGRWFPPDQPTELNLFFLDAQYLYGLVAGIVGYLAGRSRRSAFCAGVLGVTIADVAHYVGARLSGIHQTGVATVIGGGGFWDTTVVAGVLGVLLAEFIGETSEAIQGGSAAAEGRPTPGGDDRARP